MAATGSRSSPAPDELVRAVQIQVRARCDPGFDKNPREDHTIEILRLFQVIRQHHRGMCGGVAGELLGTLVPTVLHCSAAVRELMRDDPAAPLLEQRYGCVRGEMATLASLLCVAQASALDENPAITAAWHGICRELRALIDASEQAKPTWRLLRHSFMRHRGAPPARPAPVRPPADDAEYYLTAGGLE